MTFTKEWLQKAISDIETMRDEIPFGLDEDGNNTLAALKLALAGMEAEPVAWSVGGITTHDKKWAARRSEEDNLLMEPLYRHPIITGIDENHYDPELEPGLYVAEIMTKGGAAIINGYYAAPQPLTTSERAELENYRNAQQVVPDDGRDQFEEWFKFHHGDEHSIVMLQRANGGANYIDPYVDLAWISWKDSRAAMLQDKAEVQRQELTVWYGDMPETNGMKNWTAIIHRKGECLSTGITIDRSEYPDRTRYKADRMRFLIGEITDNPDCLDYDADAHSGYVNPGNSPVIPDGWVMVPVEPTAEMYDAGDRQLATKQVWDAMLAAAPQQKSE